jgi:serine/threonine protein kinase
MTQTKFLRDARHLDKYIYTLSNINFYEPFEDQYRPSSEYVSIVMELLGNGWSAARDGYWFFVYPTDLPVRTTGESSRRAQWPIQGWKIHVSATMRNAEAILRRAAAIVLANKTPFKFALDKNVISIMTSKGWQRGASGKFITIYPQDLSHFKDLLEQLYVEFKKDEGPYILSDRRYRDCRVLYYRFGGFAQISQMNITGEKVLSLKAPDGRFVPDIRTPYFAVPSWAVDPYPDQEPQTGDATLKAGRYRVKQALKFSNSGGVYLAEDRLTGNQVVIKEARAHTAVDDRGNDAIAVLKKEKEILELLAGTGVAPKPLDSFYDWENFFLAEEYLDGVDVRQIMLRHSPLMRVWPSLTGSNQYYGIFKEVFRSFAEAIDLLHEHNVVLGDLSANNIKIDPSTYAVRLIDFEGAFRPGVDQPTYLYTPGFREALNVRRNTQSFADDLYSLASIMLYMLFPIAALSSLRDDLYRTVLKVMLADVGWAHTEVFDVLNSLSNGKITCVRARELLEEPTTILPPKYNDGLESEFCNEVVNELGSFILDNLHTNERGALFPSDPFMYKTNPLSLGFGACGVLYALKKCGFEIPQCAHDWLIQELNNLDNEALPPGLLTGTAGIAWCISELGLEDRAAEMMKMANRSRLLKYHHSYFYGMAGIGMANLYFYSRSKESEYLSIAMDLADTLVKVARESEIGIHWRVNELVHLGYGYGQSGVALFFLRLSQLSGEKEFLLKGRRALEFDLNHAVQVENGVSSFPRTPSDQSTLLPYLEEGSAGIAKVAIRYGAWDRMDMALSDLYRKYSGFAGLLYGLASFIDVFTDAFLFSRHPRFLDMATRPISGIRDIYLIKQRRGAATPGDNLFRISCDYATGVAGVMRALHRFARLGDADFVLDELSEVSGSSDLVPARVQAVGKSI